MSWNIHVYSTLDDAREQWETFFSTMGTSSMTMTWQFASLWWKYYGDGFTPYIISVTDEHHHGLLMPLMKQGNNLSWIGTPEPDSLTFIHNSAEKLPEAIRALGEFLLQVQWSKISLRYLYRPQSDMLIESMGKTAYRIREETSSPYLPLDRFKTWDEYWASRTRDTRASVGKKFRKAQRDGYTIRYETLSDPREIVKYFEPIKHIVSLGDIPEKHEGMQGHHGEFLFELWRTYAECGWLDLHLCFFNDELVTYATHFAINGARTGMSVSYHPQYRDYGPGKLLMEDITRKAIEHGDHIFDLQHGPDTYKMEWADEAIPLVYITFYRSPLKKHLSQLQDTVKGLLKRKG